MLRAKPAFPPSMAVRGHPGIYLFAAVFAAVSISACAPIMEDRPQIMIYMRLFVGVTSSGESAVRIVHIQKANDPSTSYTPSPDARMLWLRKGDYEAQLTCLRSAGDNQTVLSRAAPADVDGFFHFTMQHQIAPQFNTEYTYYRLDCAVRADGKAAFVVIPIMEITGE